MQEHANGCFAFWTTTELDIAHQYATINPVQGEPAILGFEIPLSILGHCLSSVPSLAEEDVLDKAIGFWPDSFVIMNQAMTNHSIRVVTTEL